MTEPLPPLAELVEPAEPSARPSDHALGFALLSAALLGAAALFPLDRPPLSLFACPLKAATGWPCLFCGATHAFAHLVHGHPGDALAASPLGTLLALAALAHLAATCARLCGFSFTPPAVRFGLRLRLATLALLAANWVFVAARTRGVL